MIAELLRDNSEAARDSDNRHREMGSYTDSLMQKNAASVFYNLNEWYFFFFFYQRENRIESYVGEALLDELDGEHVILHAELHQFLRVAAEGEELDAVAGHEIAEALCDAVNIIAKREGENVCVCASRTVSGDADVVARALQSQSKGDERLHVASGADRHDRDVHAPRRLRH